LCACFFIAFFLVKQNGATVPENVTILMSERVTNWGRWFEWSYCPANTFASGFQLESEPMQGGGDDSALNQVYLLCTKPNRTMASARVHSGGGDFGHLGKEFCC